MNLDERKVGAVLHRMADEAEWRPGLPKDTLRRARVRRATAAAVTLAMIAGLAYGGAVVASPFSTPHQTAGPLTGKIAFRQESIYVVNADGSDLHRLTDLPGDVSPSWSPDGTQIAFERELGNHQDVYVMDADGSNLRRLTTNGRSGEPAWSPTGDRIAFRRDFAGNGRRTNRIRLFVMKPDGSAVHRVSRGSSLAYETAASWSPDGSRLAFLGYHRRLGPGRVYIVKPGGLPKSVPAPRGTNLNPAWSPDGQNLLVVAGGYKGGSLFTVAPSGADPRRLKGGSGLVYDPAWAPDSQAVVFARGPVHPSSQLEFGRTRLYILTLRDGTLQPLTPPGMTGAREPSWWSPKPSVTPSPSPTSGTNSEKLLTTARIPMPSGVTDVAVGEDAVWVTGFQEMSRVDPSSGRVVATIPLPGLGDFSSVAVGTGAVWVTGSEKGFRGVYKIDPATNKVIDQIPLSGNATGITVGAGSVWVTRATGGRGNVVRIDESNDRIIGNPILVGVGPGPILYAAGAVFVTNTDYGGSVSRIDPETGSAVTPWGVAPNVQAFGARSLWSVRDNLVTRIDLRSGRIVAQIPLKRAAAVAFEDGRVWAITEPRSKSQTLYVPDPRHPGTVVTIDPQTNQIASRPIPYGQTAAYIDIQGSVAWIGDYNKQILSRVEVKSPSQKNNT